MQEIVVLDFETTGLSATRHRVIEVSAVILEGTTIKGVFNTLVNPGENIKIPSFITKLTGIKKEMLSGQPDSSTAMRELHKFVGDRWILAHNAAFDKGFYHSEMSRIGNAVSNTFLCSLLLARRLLPQAPSHKLSSLKHFLNYKVQADHQDHRAYSDVLVTIHLWHRLNAEMRTLAKLSHVSFDALLTVSKASKFKLMDIAASIGGDCNFSDTTVATHIDANQKNDNKCSRKRKQSSFDGGLSNLCKARRGANDINDVEVHDSNSHVKIETVLMKPLICAHSVTTSATSDSINNIGTCITPRSPFLDLNVENDEFSYFEETNPDLSISTTTTHQSEILMLDSINESGFLKEQEAGNKLQHENDDSTATSSNNNITLNSAQQLTQETVIAVDSSPDSVKKLFSIFTRQPHVLKATHSHTVTGNKVRSGRQMRVCLPQAVFLKKHQSFRNVPVSMV